MTDNYLSHDCIFAPATVPGTGAICIIRISGDKCFEAVDAIVAFKSRNASSSKGYTIKRGVVKDTDGSIVDDVLVSIFRAPNSYTGEDSVELSCHSSTYITSRIMALLSKNGARLASRGEFTCRAYLNGKMDLSQAEAVADIIASDGESSHKLAISHLMGGYSSKIRTIRDEITRLASLVELELDFSEEDVTFASRQTIRSLSCSLRDECRKFSDSFAAGNSIKNGISVAIAGAPNSGKSTLLNALLEYDRAIVSPIAGTTRDTIEECIFLDGVKFRLIDTAGLRDSDDELERQGVERSRSELSKAMVVLGVIDGTQSDIAEKIETLRKLCGAGRQLILAINKSDLRGPQSVPVGSSPILSPVTSKTSPVSEGQSRMESTDSYELVSISALKGDGLEDLKKALLKCVPSYGENGEVVTSRRHSAALADAADSLDKVISAIDNAIPGDLLAEDLREAVSSINSILGEGLGISDLASSCREALTPEAILSEIFSHFCIGK